MKEFEKKHTVSGDTESLAEEIDGGLEGTETEPEDVGDSPSEDSSRCGNLRQNLPRIAIYARYLLPVFTGAMLLVLSFFDLIYFYMAGSRWKISLINFYKDTLSSTHAYLGGKTGVDGNWFYGLLSAGAIVGILFWLIAFFFALLAAVTACRAFAAGHESEESNRMKLIFKIAFPNRICLFASNLLFLVPTLFANYFSAIGKSFMGSGSEAPIYGVVNVPFFIVCALTAVTLLLSIGISRAERQKKMNMFLLWHPEEDETDEPNDEGELE